MIEQCEQALIDAGERVSKGGSWEDDRHAYAFSYRGLPGTYGDAAVTACFHKEMGLLELAGDVRQP